VFLYPVPSPENRLLKTLLESDSEFAETLGLELTSGRFFQREFSSDSPSIVINESASQRLCRVYSWENPLGQQVTTGRQIFTIIGVLEDFHFHSLHTQIGPLGILPLPKGQGQYMSVRIRPENIPQTMSFIKDKWTTFAPDQPIQYSFLSDDFERLYNTEEKTGRLLAVFALLAVFIGCLGLSRRLCHQCSHNASQAIFCVGAARQYPCLAGRILCDEPLASEFRLSYRNKFVHVHRLWFIGFRDCEPGCQLSGRKMCHGQSSRFVTV